MHRRTLTISTLVIIAFIVAAFSYQLLAGQNTSPAAAASASLVRPHSPIIGPTDAPVTIVEFFDPSCEACRAFYPIVKDIMSEFPDEVRLALRYTLFHNGSEEAARILEVARQQEVFVPVLEAVLSAQPQWHDDPQIEAAWEAAEAAGLDVEKARETMNAPDINATLAQDTADLNAFKVRGTPTFYVNGQPLANLHPQQLYDLVRSEVMESR